MTITTTTLTRAAGCAPPSPGCCSSASRSAIPTWTRSSPPRPSGRSGKTVKVLMAVLSLIGITGMYLRQVKQTGVLGLLGYLVFGAGYLLTAEHRIIGCVRPAIPRQQLTRTTSTTSSSRRPAATRPATSARCRPSSSAARLHLPRRRPPLRHRALPRQQSSPVGPRRSSPSAPSRPSRPPCCRRSTRGCSPFPTGIAMVGLGYSLWREQRTPAARPVPSSVGSPLDPAGAK